MRKSLDSEILRLGEELGNELNGKFAGLACVLQWLFVLATGMFGISPTPSSTQGCIVSVKDVTSMQRGSEHGNPLL